MTALPGQRSAQQPLRAMTSAQRALGRAAQAGAGGLGSVGIAFIDGETYDVDLSASAGGVVRRVEPPIRDSGPDSGAAVGGPDQERE